jgi:hypothetical protein
MNSLGHFLLVAERVAERMAETGGGTVFAPRRPPTRRPQPPNSALQRHHAPGHGPASGRPVDTLHLFTPAAPNPAGSHDFLALRVALAAW